MLNSFKNINQLKYVIEPSIYARLYTEYDLILIQEKIKTTLEIFGRSSIEFSSHTKTIYSICFIVKDERGQKLTNTAHLFDFQANL